MSTPERLFFMSRMNSKFRNAAFAELIGGNLWHTGVWAYLMGQEL